MPASVISWVETVSDKSLLYGTLDTLILRTLAEGARHGYGIARWLETRTDNHLQIDESSLYPALYRLHKQGFLDSEWNQTELGRRAKFYSLTAKGRKALRKRTQEWVLFADAVGGLLLDPEEP